MNIRWQFNLVNQSFLSDWQIYIGERYCILHALGNKKENLAVFIWQIFVIRQTTIINSKPNFHLIQ